MITLSPPTVARSRQQGFSLIEMAVVLFVLTLLLVATLRGQEVIGMTQVSSLARDFRDIPTFVYGYQDKARALPGDDRGATARFGLATTVDGDGNGRIDGNWFDGGATSEASRAWLHLRLAGLSSGPTDTAAADYQPMNALGKPLGIQSGVSDPASAPILDGNGHPISGNFIICSRGIPGDLALALDVKLDDGNPASGSMLATPDTGSAYAPGALAVAAPNPGSFYIVCRGT
jgi:prepilin-type N-terminal cleavage/methylation domain-containing protein